MLRDTPSPKINKKKKKKITQKLLSKCSAFVHFRLISLLSSKYFVQDFRYHPPILNY